MRIAIEAYATGEKKKKKKDARNSLSAIFERNQGFASLSKKLSSICEGQLFKFFSRQAVEPNTLMF